MPDEHPIVERPDWLWDDEYPFPPASTKDNRQQQLRDYIEYLEDALDERDQDLIRLYGRVRDLENVRK